MAGPDDEIDYASWGEEFFASAVTVDRVLAGVNVLAGRPIDVGPLGVGPGRLVKVRARGQIGTARGERTGERSASFDVELPVSLEFVIDLGMDKQRFLADIRVPLAITARPRRDLAIVIDVTPPTPLQVEVALKASGLRATLTQHAAGVEGELRRFVARYVARELEKPYVREATLIDVASAIDRAMEHLGPKRFGEDVTEDLPDALQAEIAENAELFLGEETAP